MRPPQATMPPTTPPPTTSLAPPASPASAAPRHRKLRLFAIGLSIRLLGLWLIWVGDKHDSVFRKSLVVIGVILSIGGIGVLKFLLYHGMRKKPLPR